MARTNVTTWQDCCTITKLQNELAQAMMKYQMYAAPREDGRWGVGSLGGDQDVIVAAINLKDRLNKLIDRSRDAYKKSRELAETAQIL